MTRDCWASRFTRTSSPTDADCSSHYTCVHAGHGERQSQHAPADEHAGARPARAVHARCERQRSIPGSETVFIDQTRRTSGTTAAACFSTRTTASSTSPTATTRTPANSQQITGGLFFGRDAHRRGQARRRRSATRRRGARRAKSAPNWPKYFIPNDNPFVGVTNALRGDSAPSACAARTG